MPDNEIERQYRVVDLMLSAHSRLRDEYRRRSFILSCFLLGAAVVLNACVFVDDATLTILGLNPTRAKIAIGIASIAVFFISLVELRIDWDGHAQNHKDAVGKLSSLKAKLRLHIASADEDKISVNKEIVAECANALGELPPIPEAVFHRLKRHHLRKKLLSKRISSNPGAPIFLLKLQIWWQGIKELAKREDK